MQPINKMEMRAKANNRFLNHDRYNDRKPQPAHNQTRNPFPFLSKALLVAAFSETCWFFQTRGTLICIFRVFLGFFYLPRPIATQASVGCLCQHPPLFHRLQRLDLLVPHLRAKATTRRICNVQDVRAWLGRETKTLLEKVEMF